ncbi:MAG: hypothetical protein LBG57_01040 [Treponema sp.]|jgi:hypothetical protein|nr:hypothetical protein [Treponema sp.]
MGLLSKAAAILNSAVSIGGEASSRRAGPIPDKTETSAAGIWTLIENFQKNNPFFYCIVLETLPKNAARNVIRAAGIMASHFGVVRILPDGNCMVLVPGGLDGKLIAHRLSKSIKAKTLSLFSAESVSGAFEALRAHL